MSPPELGVDTWAGRVGIQVMSTGADWLRCCKCLCSHLHCRPLLLSVYPANPTAVTVWPVISPGNPAAVRVPSALPTPFLVSPLALPSAAVVLPAPW
ncbi:hypothetical protein GDO78_005676 [Eleutherodactylus coqui]|uniref:Uncharacterized protein n=1 Tax=Eleutherodactylus coqui TaxID=57060 RepID=A0A8J6FL82_ELECQ|nr:hypothetical protein GDO78_005676 [Eleutherodactylus coqui]